MHTKKQGAKPPIIQIKVDRDLVARAQRAQGFKYLSAAALIRGLLSETIEQAARPTPHQQEAMDRNRERREEAAAEAVE